MGRERKDRNDRSSPDVLVALLLFAPLSCLGFLRLIEPLRYGLAAASTAVYDADELQHSHSAWCFSQGALPYRDFFEHHTPLLYCQLAPLFSQIRPETSHEAALLALLRGRQLMWFWTTLSLLGVVAIGVIWRSGIRGAATGIFAASFLSSVSIFWDKSLEIRPDGPSTALVLAAVACFCFVLRPRSIQPQWMNRGGLLFVAFLGGMAISLAILHTQKVLFLGPGMAAFWIIYLAVPRAGYGVRQRLAVVCAAVTGVAIPMCAAVGWFAYHDGLDAFLWFNLGYNAKWEHQFGPMESIIYNSSRNVAYLVLSGVGALKVLALLVTGKRTDLFIDGLIVATAVSGIFGLFVVQAPYYQCFLVFLPFLALLAADALLSLHLLIVHLACRTFGGRTNNNRELDQKRSLMTAVSVMWASLQLLCITSMNDSYDAQSMRQNFDQLRRLQWIMNHTEPSDQVFNGWPPDGAFRPHSWFYWSHQGELLTMIPEQSKREFVASVLNGSVRPKVFVWDYFLENLSPELKSYVRANYANHSYNFWVRRSDEAGNTAETK